MPGAEHDVRFAGAPVGMHAGRDDDRFGGWVMLKAEQKTPAAGRGPVWSRRGPLPGGEKTGGDGDSPEGLSAPRGARPWQRGLKKRGGRPGGC